MNPFPNVSAAQLCHYHDKAVNLKQKHLIRAWISCGHSNNDLVLISLISSHWSWNEATWGNLTWHAFLIFIFKWRFKGISSIQVQDAIIINFLGCRTRLSLHNCQENKKTKQAAGTLTACFPFALLQASLPGTVLTRALYQPLPVFTPGLTLP